MGHIPDSRAPALGDARHCHRRDGATNIENGFVVGQNLLFVDGSPHRSVNPWIVTIAVMMATFMELLDTTVVNVAIPHLGGSLAATVEEGTWVVTSYLVANAIVLPMSGWLANYLGRKNLLLICVAGFTVTSLFCGMATSLSGLIF